MPTSNTERPGLISIETSPLPEDYRAHTGYQRLALFGQYFDLTVLKPSSRSICETLLGNARVVDFRGFERLSRTLNVGLFYFWALFVLRRYRHTGAAVCTTTGWPALVGILAARLYGLRWVYSIWDDPFLDAHYNRQLGKHLKAWVYWLRGRLTARFHRCANVVILNMHPEALAGIDIQPPVLIQATNGHDCETPVPELSREEEPRRTVHVLYVGVVSAPRGCDLLVRAVSGLRREGLDIVLDLVGPLCEQFAAAVRSTLGGDAGWCRLHGPAAHPDCLGYIEAADVCVFPFPDTGELRYIYPIKVLEYMALGRPIVASRLVGVAELVTEDYDAACFEAGNVADCEAVLRRVITDVDFARRLGRNAQETAPKYRWQDINQRIAAELAEVLTGTGVTAACSREIAQQRTGT